ncbi:Enoyl-CoA hydratase [Balamuthia mandrillaris]
MNAKPSLVQQVAFGGVWRSSGSARKAFAASPLSVFASSSHRRSERMALLAPVRPPCWPAPQPKQRMSYFPYRNVLPVKIPNGGWKVDLYPVEWDDEKRREEHFVAVLTMDSNVNKAINSKFVRDWRNTLDFMQANYPNYPLVFTSTGPTFSVGINFRQLMREEGEGQVNLLLSEVEELLKRVWTYPRPTVAAINGHAVADGLLLALACDSNVSVNDKQKRCLFGLTHIRVGLSLSPLLIELVRSRMPTNVATEWMLSDKVYTINEAHRVAVLNEILPVEPTDDDDSDDPFEHDIEDADFGPVQVPTRHEQWLRATFPNPKAPLIEKKLVERAVEIAGHLRLGSYDAYAQSKHLLLRPHLERAERVEKELSSGATPFGRVMPSFLRQQKRDDNNTKKS